MAAAAMSVVYVLTTLILEDGENATMEQIRKMNKWDNNDYVCTCLILKVPRPSLKILNGTEDIGGSTVPEEATKEALENQLLSVSLLTCLGKRIKRRRRDLSSDGIRNLATASGSGRLKEDLESSTWRRRLEFKATPSQRWHTMEDETLVRKLLNAIPDRYLQIDASIEQYSDLSEMTLEEAIGRLKTYEERIKYKKGHKAIGLKWVFKTKRDANGNIIKHKARLVAKGYIQEHGIDFEEVFAPVARMETIRLLLAIAANNKWEVHHLDVKFAFLHGDLKKEVYVTQPEGFVEKQDQVKVYRLIKALYGLRQAPCEWNIKLDNTLKSLDDLIITGTPKKEIDKFKAQMEEKLKMSNLGLLAYYLGIEVTQTNGIKQSAYANKILKEAGMIDCNETLIPMDPRTRLTKVTEGAMVNSIKYRSLIGCLRYLLHTRPGLSYSVGLLSRFMQEPREQHMKAIRQVLRYVKGTKDYGITYKHNGGNKIHGYIDSSYGVNTQGGKGTIGIIFYYGESPISWSTQKQATVALSSCESKFIAATVAATQALWLKRLLSKLTNSKEDKVTIRVDNKSAIALMKSPVFHERSKHIDTKYHIIREYVKREDTQVEFDLAEIIHAMMVNNHNNQMVFSTWMAFGGNTHDLSSFREEIDEITDLHQIVEEVLLTKRGDGVAGIKRRRRDPSIDGVRDLVTASGRNNVVPIRSDTIQLVQNEWSFHGLWSEDPNQHLKDFLNLVYSLNLDGENRERMCLRLFQFSLRDQASNWLERLPAGSITTWEDLTTSWTRLKDLLQKVLHHGLDLWLQVQIFYDHIACTTQIGIDYTASRRLKKLRLGEAWATIERLSQYEDERWDDAFILVDMRLNYKNPHIKQLLGIIERKVDTLMKDTILLMGRNESIFWMTTNKMYRPPSELSRQEEFEHIVMNFILDQEERVKRLKEYMKVIVSDFMQLSSEVTRGLKKKTGGEQKEMSLLKFRQRISLYTEQQSRDRVKSIRDPKVRLAHRCIETTISGRKESTNRVIKIDLYYLYCIYTNEVICNISYWLAKYLKSVGDKNLICEGMLVTKIARSFGVLIGKLMNALSVKPTPHVFKKKSLIAMRVIMELHTEGCCWPTTREAEVKEEDEGDDGRDEATRGYVGHKGIGGSTNIYRNMSQGDCTWMTFKGNTHDLGSFGEETDEITDLHQILEEVLLTERGDSVTGIKRRRRDPSSDRKSLTTTASIIVSKDNTIVIDLSVQEHEIKDDHILMAPIKQNKKNQVKITGRNMLCRLFDEDANEEDEDNEDDECKDGYERRNQDNAKLDSPWLANEVIHESKKRKIEANLATWKWNDVAEIKVRTMRTFSMGIMILLMTFCQFPYQEEYKKPSFRV
nr:ribonuclease H-like domain, reverse transcriptase, RNA-dependent DNA polymerase [Tanacetum cinerariifolium]